MTQRRFAYDDEDRARDYREVFLSAAGQRVLADLVLQCHVVSPIRPGDPYAAAHAEGERNVALRILSFLHYTPEQFRGMQAFIEDTLGDA